MTIMKMKAYIGLLVGMGLHPSDQLPDYWSQTPLFHNLAISCVMSRNEFQMITKFLHLNLTPHDETLTGREKLEAQYLVFAQMLLETNNDVITLEKNLSLDESRIASKSRIGIIQYNSKKPIKYGYTAFKLCEASSGFVYRFRLYLGKKYDIPTDNGLGYDVAMSLIDDLEGKGHHIFADSWYSSVNLVNQFSDLGFSFTGSIRRDRVNLPEDVRIVGKSKKSLPSNVEPIPFTEGERLFWGKHVTDEQDIMVCLFFDNAIIATISNNHNNAMTTTFRRKKDSTKKKIDIPVMVQRYSDHMGGVDLANQLIGSYKIGFRSKKWWKAIFYHLIDIAVINSYVLYTKIMKTANKLVKTQRQFRLELFDALVNEQRLFYSSNGAKKRKAPNTMEITTVITSTQSQTSVITRNMIFQKSENFLNIQHYPCIGDKLRDCYVCSTNESRKKTTYMCEQCDIYMHCPDCFKNWHERLLKH